MSLAPWTWPELTIRRPDTRKRVSLKVEEWPEEDRLAWGRATQPADLFDEPGAASHLRPKSRTFLIGGYGRWLGFLSATAPELLCRNAGERVTPERIECFCRHLAETNGARSGANTLRGVRQVLLLVAPTCDWTWLHQLANRVVARTRPRPKAARLRLSDELYQLGLDLMDQAEKEVAARNVPRQKDALLYRDGLMISLLAVAPIRRTNLTGLGFDQSLQRTGTVWSIVLAASETKTGSALEYPIPSNVGERIDAFVARFRPSICRSNSHLGVWASPKGGPLTPDAIFKVVCRRTSKAFGQPVNPHLFRDAAATFLSVRAPEAILSARDLLGHRSMDTTDKHYRQAQTTQAARRYASILDQTLNSA